eukprot:TRINITY_DN68279_c0_g1_i1.p1 TRINITY_DN68279_c0_g1~~TRINITY_DN68279_c0_g1_i1.p1  ORF type:complete len:290 (-),score=22.52 TRINITY_DN68279_c0_g1_i1:156-1025(-)
MLWRCQIRPQAQQCTSMAHRRRHLVAFVFTAVVVWRWSGGPCNASFLLPHLTASPVIGAANMRDSSSFRQARGRVANAVAADGGVANMADSGATVAQGVGDAVTVQASQPVRRSLLVQAWGVFGVAAYLTYGAKKVVPVIVEGFGAINQPWQWGLMAATLTFFAYYEGYRGFQQGFAPRVVSRAWILSEQSPSTPLWHKILAPAFSIGYFHGTRARVISSWTVTTIIFLVVVGVKRMPNPYRGILDAGVILGLAWGVVSILMIYAKARLTGRPPKFNPSLPATTPYTVP